MSSSAVTLQCPACGGVFLTLQQGTGGAEICPHCSMSAPRARYRSMESQGGPGARTSLPPRRPETAPGTTSQPVPVLTSAMTPEVVPTERSNFGTTLPPVRPGTATGKVNLVPPAPEPKVAEPAPVTASTPAAGTMFSTGPIPLPTSFSPTPAPTPTQTSEVQVQPVYFGAAPEYSAQVASDRVPMPPVAPGELPLPSRVLQTLPPTPSVPVASPPAAPPQVTSPFSAVVIPPLVETAPPPPAPAAPVPVVMPLAPPAPQPVPVPVPVDEAPAVPVPAPAPVYQPPAAHFYAPAEALPQPVSPLEPTPAPPPPTLPSQVLQQLHPAPPAPASQYPYPYQQPQGYPPQAAQLPVAYPPVPAPPPAPIDSAALAKASPAQLWEAAVLQHHHQAQDVSIMPTGRELFASGAVPTFQPPPPPSGPVTFGPLTPPEQVVAPAAAPEPPPAVDNSSPPTPAPLGNGRPHTGGTVLPAARSMPPAASPLAYGSLVNSNSTAAGEPLPPPQIGFVPSVPPLAVAATPEPPLPAPPVYQHQPQQQPAPQPLPVPQVQPQPLPAVTVVPASPFAMAAAPEPAPAPVLTAPLETSPQPPPPPTASPEVAPAPAAIIPPSAPVEVAGTPAPSHALTDPPADPSRPLEDPPADPSHEYLPHHPAQDLSLVAKKMVRNSSPPTAAAPPRRRTAPWIAGLALGSLAVAGGLHFLKDRLQHFTGTDTPDVSTPTAGTSTPSPEIKKATAPTAAELAANTSTPEATPANTPVPEVKPAQVPAKETAQTSVSATPSPTATATPANEAAPATLPVPPMPGPPQEEVRRAMPPSTEGPSISQADPLPAIATKLVFSFDSASTPEDRAKWIADPDKYTADMERLIRLRGGRLNTREVEPLPVSKSGPVRALPSGEEVALFRVASPASRGGAILRLHAQNGKYLIDWPLFAQTYDNAFDRFVATNRALPGKAEWYTVLCSLAGNATGKNATQESHLRLKVQGSLSETGVTEAWVEKNSPAGRFLQQEMETGHTYLIDIQFGASDAGSRRLMVLDCSATRGESAQANANK